MSKDVAGGLLLLAILCEMMVGWWLRNLLTGSTRIGVGSRLL